MSDAFHLYALDHPNLARTLRAKLALRRAELVAILGDGYCQDWADYKYRIGEIRGLDEAIAICEKSEQEQRN